MSARSFFGTNVLIYADDEAAPAKQRKAVNLVAEHRACEDRGGIAAGAAGVFRHGQAETSGGRHDGPPQGRTAGGV